MLRIQITRAVSLKLLLQPRTTVRSRYVFSTLQSQRPPIINAQLSNCLLHRSVASVLLCQHFASKANVDIEAVQSLYVLVHGLPRTMTKDDVETLFRGVKTKNGKHSIKLLYRADGRSSGEALIECESNSDAEKLLSFHNKTIGRMQLRVRIMPQVPSNVFDKARESNAADKSTVIFLMGIPFEATLDDLAHFLTGIDIVPNGVRLYGQRGFAKVQLTSPEIVAKACQLDGKTMGNRYIEVLRSKLSDINEDLDMHEKVYLTPIDNNDLQIKMFQMPYSVTVKDIKQALAPLVPSKVTILTSKDGRTIGRAIVAFKTKEECDSALEKDGVKIHGRHTRIEKNLGTFHLLE